MRGLQSSRKRHFLRKRCFGILVRIAVSVIFWVGWGITDIANAGMLIYPAKGQSAEQQQKDEFECHQWAVQQTGYDPTRAQQAPGQQTTRRGGAVRGAAGWPGIDFIPQKVNPIFEPFGGME